MIKGKPPTVDELLQREEWDDARKLVERELKRQPNDHWLLTQLGVTYYEQGRYREALSPLLDSLAIVPDCPLTLWNVAGTLDALGKPEVAVPIYAWLLGSKKSADDDPCWESDEWSDSLKTDSVYRIGTCLQRMERWESAEHCFREYINLILAGVDGAYQLQDAARRIRECRDKGAARLADGVRDAINSTLEDSGVRSAQGGRAS